MTTAERPGRGRALSGGTAVPPHRSGIALRAIDGHLAYTQGQVWAWYRMAPQSWNYRGDGPREAVISQAAAQLGELQGHWLHLRVTHRPWPVARWAAAHAANSHDRPADVRGALAWAAYLDGERQRSASSASPSKDVYLGVEVSGRSRLDRAVERAAPWLGRLAPQAVRVENTALATRVAHVDALVAGAGLAATPASAGEVAWLVRRSCQLGMPDGGGRSPVLGPLAWEPEDLAAVEAVHAHHEPYAATVQVVGRCGGATVTRHVAVLTVGLMEGLEIPAAHDPWMATTDRLPFPVEWSARLYVRRPEEVAGELQRQMGKVRSQIRHYTHDHDLDPPISLTRQAEHVLEIEDQLSGGLTQTNSRVQGWWRLAVAGVDEAQALDRAQRVVELYRPAVQIEHPEGQYQLAREFIPGEPLATSAYRRRGSVLWAAAAVPSVATQVGDQRGIVLGQTASGGHKPVLWDPWLAQEERQASGLTGIVGGLGAGKSALTGLIVYKTLRSGARWTVLDPSGPLAALTRLPELAPYSRHINLLRAEPGILNPYRVVAEPAAADVRAATAPGEDPEYVWRRERALAAATRRRLVLDVLTGLLPWDVSRQPQTRIVLLRAVRAVGGGIDREPGQVIAALRACGRGELVAGAADEAITVEEQAHARVVADFLDERRELPQAALLFPDAGRPDPWAALDEREYRLTVLTMQGLNLPRAGTSRAEWSDAESVAVELLNLASWLTQRTVYSADRHARKGVALDETHFLSQVGTGKALIDRLARDSRKFNVRALFASQLAGDLLRVPGFASLVDAVFVGRTDDREAQDDALRLLRVPTDVGYEESLGQLSPPGQPRGQGREFLFADGGGGVEKLRVDLAGPHLAHVLAALDTNPDGHRATPVGGGTTARPPAGASIPKRRLS